MFTCCRSSRLPRRLRRALAAHFPALDLDCVTVHLHIPWPVMRFAVITPAAVTFGRHIFFAPERYDPESPAGIALIAHELVHCRQYQEHGAARFLRAYLGDFFGNKRCGMSDSEAYEAIAFEREAGEMELQILEDPAIRAYRAGKDRK